MLTVPEASTAIYLRLSHGDGDTIAAQRMLLRRYTEKGGFPHIREYADDGYSGTGFARPAFLRLMADIESGKIATVIVKDMSRLGRNSALTGNLTDEFFARHGVRLISVCDGFDTSNKSGFTVVPVVNAVNELYSRDLSVKIRAALRSRMENGDFTGSRAPYGYRRGSDNRSRLVPVKEEAAVVKRIFRMAAASSRQEIAAELNRERVPPPSGAGTWCASGVGKILSRQVYLGVSEQGKTRKLSFRSRVSVQVPEKDRILVENTHKPLISREAWDAVRRAPTRADFENIFSGVAYCSYCGAPMSSAKSRRKTAPYDLICGCYKSGGSCVSNRIRYDDLRAAVQQALDKRLSGKAELIASRAAAVIGADKKSRELLKSRAENMIHEPLTASRVKSFIGRIEIGSTAELWFR